MPTGGRRREAAWAPQLLCIDASSCWRSQLGAGRGVLPLKHGRARSGAVSSSRVSAATSAVLDDGAALRSGAAVPPSRSGLGLTAPTGSPQPSAPSPQRPKRLGRLVRHRRSGEERFFFRGDGPAVGAVRVSGRGGDGRSGASSGRGGDSRRGERKSPPPKFPGSGRGEPGDVRAAGGSRLRKGMFGGAAAARLPPQHPLPAAAAAAPAPR